jgi:hypothetical protein
MHQSKNPTLEALSGVSITTTVVGILGAIIGFCFVAVPNYSYFSSFHISIFSVQVVLLILSGSLTLSATKTKLIEAQKGCGISVSGNVLKHM